MKEITKYAQIVEFTEFAQLGKIGQSAETPIVVWQTIARTLLAYGIRAEEIEAVDAGETHYLIVRTNVQGNTGEPESMIVGFSSDGDTIIIVGYRRRFTEGFATYWSSRAEGSVISNVEKIAKNAAVEIMRLHLGEQDEQSR